MRDPYLRAWLRSTAVGSCELPAGSQRAAIDVGNGSIICDQLQVFGRWELPGHASATWVDASSLCVGWCAQCTRCRYVSLSNALDHCLWHSACEKLETLDSTLSLPYRPSAYRTARVNDHMKRRVASLSDLQGVHDTRGVQFLSLAGVGTCGRAKWNRLNDCETDAQGSFRVHAADRASLPTLAASCAAQCARCRRCVHLSVSLAYGVCSWYASDCSLPATVHEPKPGVAFAGTYHLGVDVTAGLNGSRFLSNRMKAVDVPPIWRQSELDFLRRYLPKSALPPEGARTAEALLPRAPSPLPPPLAGPSANVRRLLLVTTTYSSPHQLTMLLHLSSDHFKAQRAGSVLWIVVEDAAVPNATIRAALSRTGVPHVYLACGPTRRKGHAQRNLAYAYIRRRKLRGVVYNADDDNSYAPALWNELRTVRRGRVGVLSVQMDRFAFLERPLYDGDGRFKGFDAGWCQAGGWSEVRLGPRFFCVDMGGFAFSSELLWTAAAPLANGTEALEALDVSSRAGAPIVPMLASSQSAGPGPGQRVGNVVAARSNPWEYGGILKWMPPTPKNVNQRRRRQRQYQQRQQQRMRRPHYHRQQQQQAEPHLEWRGGESEFIQALMPNGFPEDLQPLGNCGHDVLVYHNGYFAKHSRDPKHGEDERAAHSMWERNVHAPVRPFCKLDGW